MIDEFFVIFEPQSKVQNQKVEISGFLPPVAHKKWQNRILRHYFCQNFTNRRWNNLCHNLWRKIMTNDQWRWFEDQKCNKLHWVTSKILHHIWKCNLINYNVYKLTHCEIYLLWAKLSRKMRLYFMSDNRVV